MRCGAQVELDDNAVVDAIVGDEDAQAARRRPSIDIAAIRDHRAGGCHRHDAAARAENSAADGASVVIAVLNKEGGEATVRDCKGHGGNAVFQRADVSAEGDIQSAIARAVKEFGKLNIMYNNAGLGGAVGPIENVTADNWD